VTVQLLQGDCIEVMKTLPAGSVQTCVTSPPYWGLRDYGVDGQIGLEASPLEYVSRLVEVFRGVWRVLRDDGTLWLNLGDSYASAWACHRRNIVGSGSPAIGERANMLTGSLKEKDLVGIPWRVAFALQDDGWYLRSDVIWSKPNVMPESVTDRPTKAHEYMFLLSKSPKYFYDHESIKEPATELNWQSRYDRSHEGLKSLPTEKANGIRERKQDQVGKRQYTGFNERWDNQENEPSTRNKRDVWTVATQPFSAAHFATFPPKLIEPCILAGTSALGCCPKCGKPWERVTEKGKSTWQERKENGASRGININQHGEGCNHTLKAREILSVNWQPGCACDLDPIPCVVLDPFNGAGTTGLVSIQHNRDYIGIDLNPDYLQMTRERFAQVQPFLFDLHSAAIPAD
jgi:DNA modification methylase